MPQNYKHWQKLYAKGLTTPTKGDPSNDMKQQVLRRDGYKCLKCGVKYATGVALQVDHAVSRKDGGPHALWNLQALCWKCNNQKRGRSERPMREGMGFNPDIPYLQVMLLLLLAGAVIFYLLFLRK